MLLKDLVVIDRSFQKAMRLDADIHSPSALTGYIAQGTPRRVLDTMAVHLTTSRQRAFTWTGPYGCGKSSLALLLCSLIGIPPERASALKILKPEAGEPIFRAFAANAGWAINALVGRQARLIGDLAEKLGCSADSRAVLNALSEKAKHQQAPDAYLLVIDELGKYLEGDNATENAYFLQEIAETANRSEAKFVFLGILHQAVDVYASRLPRSVRDEWTKVQGRFADIPLLSSSEETVELLGHAVHVDSIGFKLSESFVQSVNLAAKAYTDRRPETDSRIAQSLLACWPLNPVTTLLLGPISRRKFAQNERSIYSFLSSSEPLGFKAFIERGEAETDTFDPADYWDYLKENFENSILTTSEGHRWMTAQEAVTRAERTGSALCVRLAKAVALIDLFRSGSGIEASPEVLAASVKHSVEDVKPLLGELIEKKVVIERRYANSYAVFAGSDFNLEASIKEAHKHFAGIEPAMLSRFAKLKPIVAREYYLRMGTLHWFQRHILPVEQLQSFAGTKVHLEGAVGAVVLLLPESADDVIDPDRLKTLYSANGLSPTDARNMILGTSKSGLRIRELLEDLQALSIVEKAPELEGDETGRAEVRIRTEYVTNALMDEVSKAFTDTMWYTGTGEVRICPRLQDLVDLSSDLCNQIFHAAPVINNELINRDHLSSQLTAARKDLMLHMVNNEAELDLGFEGFPPALALYLSMLHDLHVPGADGRLRFSLGNADDPESNYGPLWQASIAFLKDRPMATGKELFGFWSKPPFGIKQGPMPILALAFYLTNRNNLAVYLAGEFKPAMTAVTVDEWLVDPTRISFRWIEPTSEHKNFVAALARKLSVLTKKEVAAEPLAVAQAIVAVVLMAPRWAQRSTNYTSETLKLKNVVAKASDPIQLLYRDIPSIYHSKISTGLANKVLGSLKEFVVAMPGMIERVRDHLFNALKASPADLITLHARAENIKGLSGDMTLEAFIARLEAFEDSQSDIEGIISLASSRPATMWTDREIQVAMSRISELAFAFRRQETFSHLRGRSEERRVFSVAFGAAEDDATETIEISTDDAARAKMEAENLLQSLKHLPANIMLAALTEAGIATVEALKAGK